MNGIILSVLAYPECIRFYRDRIGLEILMEMNTRPEMKGTTLNNGSSAASNDEKFLALKRMGFGEFAHLNGNLESHLSGTRKLLAEWGNPEYVCDAGLYHAVYGTQPMQRLGIPHRDYSPSDRPKIKEIIGEKSERLVYLYGACDRDFLYPQIGFPAPRYRDRFTGEVLELPSRDLRDILELTMANELELCLSGPLIKEKHREGLMGLFNRFRGWVSDQAYECSQKALDA